ncbi:MAG: hypothetical protein B7L53_08130 [Thermofilum sp. NZ13]|nr:MAG: hypothetical protein B7L53_08130 [Thermofilum sp. NZ13]
MEEVRAKLKSTNPESITATIMQRMLICPVCGRRVDKLVEGVCEECYRREHPLAEPKVKRLEVEVCRSCGALRFRKGKWHSNVGDLEAEIAREASRLLRFRGYVSGVEAELSKDLSLLTLKVRGKALPELAGEYVEEYVVGVSVVRTICEACLGQVSKKKAALVQVRAKGRKFSQSELWELAKQVEEGISELALRDSSVIPVEVEEKPEGLDIYFSSYSAARRVAELLSRKMYVEVLETAKLIGIDDSGREKYKRTIRLLLPSFKAGDVVRFNGGVFYVLGVTARHVELLNLDSYAVTRLYLSHEFTSRVEVLAHVDELPEAIAVSTHGDFIQIMELESYRTLEVRLISPDAAELLTSQERLKIYWEGEKAYIIPIQGTHREAARSRA